MFWNDAPRLRSLSLPSKIAVTGFLVLAGIGYIFGFLNILVAYQDTDGERGLSVTDVRLAYYGGDGTALEGSIDGTMRGFFADDDEYNAVKEWIALGADPDTYGPIQKIMENSCVSCHNAQYAEAGAVLETYEDVEPWLEEDTGKSIGRLISLSHTHLLSTLVVVFLLVFIFSFSTFPEWLKLTLYSLAFFAIFLDIGSWWLAKLHPFFSIFVILGGALLGTTFAALTVLSLYDTWFGKEK